MGNRSTRQDRYLYARTLGACEMVDWVRYELDYDRREAQAEAEIAYRAWDEMLVPYGYAVYRAAQDRADAAQDALAAWMSAGRTADQRSRD